MADAVGFVREERPGHRIGVIGWSLGGASAVLASPLGIDALVLESVYPTIDGAIRNRVSLRLGESAADLLSPLLVSQLLGRLGVSAAELQPIDRIAAVGCPILVMGGTHDRRTTWQESRDLLGAAPDPGGLVGFQGAGHADLHAWDAERWEKRVIEFLAECFSP